VGERLAMAARALAYNQKVVYSGPIYSSMEVKDNTIVLTFDQVNKGLIARGDALTDFVISENGKEFVPAKAIISGNKIIVSATGISKPVAVRMGWSKVPHINLFNKDGLPASPFRTDIQQ
jgi:sialate O-acetylesterase